MKRRDELLELEINKKGIKDEFQFSKLGNWVDYENNTE
jgi:hypothetical protein